MGGERLRFLDLGDFPAVVVAAMLADMVRALLLAAIGALDMGIGTQAMMRPAHITL
jgi:hypothetical protein